MLQETNKFREHQARQNLIELLEEQLVERKRLTAKLRDAVTEVDGFIGTKTK